MPPHTTNVKICVLLLAVLSTVFPLGLFALGLEVRPSRIELVIGEQGTSRAELSVTNTSSETSAFSAYLDTPLDSVILTPDMFLLSPGETQNITLTIDGFGKSFFETTLSIVTEQLSQNDSLSIGSGVKIPLILYRPGASTLPESRSGGILSAFSGKPMRSQALVITAGILILFLIYVGSTRSITIAKKIRK